MSYTVPPVSAAPTPRERPATVTAASYLLYLLAALQVVYGALALATIGPNREAFEEVYAEMPELQAGAGPLAVVTGVGTMIVYLLLAAGFLVLGILDGKGKNPARIVTWVFAGVGLCCFGVVATGPAANSLMSGMSAPEGAGTIDPAEIQRIITEGLPSWYYPATTTISVLSLVSALVIIILLALRPSNEYFRKPQPAWEPPAYPSIG